MLRIDLTKQFGFETKRSLNNAKA